MRRRQLFAMREQQLLEDENQMVKVPNSNIISNDAQPLLKEKASMFLANEVDIKKPNESPYRARGSKPGKGAYQKTLKRNKY